MFLRKWFNSFNIVKISTAALCLFFGFIVFDDAAFDFQSALAAGNTKPVFQSSKKNKKSIKLRLKIPRDINYNVIMDRMYRYEDKYKLVQGAYWCEGDNYVYALVKGNEVRLVCFNVSTNTELWHIDVPAYHANTVVFNPNDRKIYICGCADHVNGKWKYINKVFVIDYDHPDSGIIKTIIVPKASMVYSIALDKKNNTWYSINAIGKTEGKFNRLHKYKGVFDSAEGYVDLKFNTVSSEGSWQGLSCIHDGVAYGVFYSKMPRVTAWDLYSGQDINQFPVEKTINGRYELKELESIFYDGTRDSLIIGAVRINATPKRYYVTFVETDILHDFEGEKDHLSEIDIEYDN